MTAAQVLHHMQYSGWATQKVFDAAATLTPEDLTRNTGVSHTSILGTLAHIYIADRIWYSRVVDPAMALTNRDVPPFESLKAQWTDVWQRWETWAAALQDGDPDRVVSFKMFDGTPMELTAVQIVMHVVNHATLHRGQAVAMIRQLGITPPATDLLFYYREQPAAQRAEA